MLLPHLLKMKSQFTTIFALILSVNSVAHSFEFCTVKVKIENVQDFKENVLVLVNGKQILTFENVKTTNEESLQILLPIHSIFSSEGNHSIAVYSIDLGFNLIALNNLFISSENYKICKNQTIGQNSSIRQKRSSPNGRSIGVQYSVWHGFAANAVFKMQKQGAHVKTIETLIQEGRSIDDYWSHGVTEADSGNGYFQVEPKRGFYCIYRKRQNEGKGVIPDCPNIEKTLSDHADMLTQSGVDYVYVDLTNLCVKSPSEDLLQRRVMEILFEEWHKLRTQGKNTPQIVAWNRIDDPGCKTWRDYLDLYERYPDLVWKDSKSGKKIFMATAKSDPTIKQQIESNNGKNDVILINNWVASTSEAHTGRWQFMGDCDNEIDRPSTDIVDRNTCNQAVTRNSPIGDQISTGVSYQMNYASSPWGATTSFYGLTFMLQWDTALKANPHHITISGWNEYFAGAWGNPWKGYVKSVGLNGKENRLFVDLFGAYRSRDIEPTLEYGNMYFDIMQSCIRVRNLNSHNNRNDCSVANEVCCQLNRFKQFTQIYSLIKKDNNDYLLTNSVTEKDSVIKTDYREVCTFNGATRQLCNNGNPADPIVGLSGPFIMYNKDGANRRPIYRCKVGTSHFISLQKDCEKQQLDNVLGYVSMKKDSLFARSLVRCITGNKVHYHSLDGSCYPNDQQEAGILGYVI